MLNAKLSAKETKVNMTGTKILANMFSQPPPPPLSTLPALLWRFLFTYFWSCAVLIRKMGDKEEDGKNSGETIKNWAKKNWGRGDQRSAGARRGAGGKERERREKLNESGVEVVRKMVAHGSMNRPVKGREAQGMCVYVTAISADGLLETLWSSLQLGSRFTLGCYTMIKLAATK